jgi:hypothetical protein
VQFVFAGLSGGAVHHDGGSGYWGEGGDVGGADWCGVRAATIAKSQALLCKVYAEYLTQATMHTNSLTQLQRRPFIEQAADAVLDQGDSLQRRGSGWLGS